MKETAQVYEEGNIMDMGIGRMNDMVTQEERNKILSVYFKDELNGRLSEIPKKLKRKRIILEHLHELFSPERRYSEKEVNDILKNVHHDYATLRRDMIEHRLLDRSDDCSEYWKLDLK